MRPLTFLFRTAILHSHLCFTSPTQLPYVTSETFLHSLCLFLHPSLFLIHNIHTPPSMLSLPLHSHRKWRSVTREKGRRGRQMSS